MLDDNVQLCHEVDVGTGEYHPCSFTHVMDSLERLMLAGHRSSVTLRTESDPRGTPKRVSKYVRDAEVRDMACPLESQRRVLRGESSTQLPESARKIATVGDLCGRPGHYGIIGIARHGHGRGNIEETTEAFGVTQSVYSFCLLNVDSTVLNKAMYPMKRYWQDIEFNHIVDEKGLLVCMFRKFSHSKKNLQPIQPRQQQPKPASKKRIQPIQPPGPPPPAPASSLEFQFKDIDLAALQQEYERYSNCVANEDHLGELLKYLSDRVLQRLGIKTVLEITEGNRLTTADDKTFEIEPAAPMTVRPTIDITLSQEPRGSILIVLLDGIQNESFGVLKIVVSHQVSVSDGAPTTETLKSPYLQRVTAYTRKSGLKQPIRCSAFQVSVVKGSRVVIVTRLPKRGTGKHIGKWLQEQQEKGWNVEVRTALSRESVKLYFEV